MKNRNKSISGIGNWKKWPLLLVLFLMLPFALAAQDAKYVPVEKVIEELKKQNFFIFTLGILSDGLDEATVKKITDLQFAPPRQMQLFITQSAFIQDIYNDFTFLVRNKQVNAVLVWPSKTWDNKDFISKTAKMSQRLRVPIIAMQEGWLEEGAMLYFTDPASPKMIVNDKVAEVFKYPVNPNTGFTIEHQ
jgi:hypothetical protein